MRNKKSKGGDATYNNTAAPDYFTPQRLKNTWPSDAHYRLAARWTQFPLLTPPSNQ